MNGSVSTNGSTSMEKVIGILTEQVMENHKGVTVTYDATGSGTGDGFESITKMKDACLLAQELTNTGAVIASVNLLVR